jgi:tetratricopeptide (TPR) repeat protein
VNAVIVLSRIEASARQHHWEDLIERDGRALVERAHLAMRVAGESWATWLALGRALREDGDLEEAVRCLRRALELNPSSNEALLFLATTLSWMDRSQEALALLETARRLDPTTRELFYHPYSMAFACFSAGRYAEAVGWAEQAAHAAPDHVGAPRLLAACLAEAGRAHEAAIVLQRLRAPVSGVDAAEHPEISPGADPAFTARYAAALRKA